MAMALLLTKHSQHAIHFYNFGRDTHNDLYRLYIDYMNPTITGKFSLPARSWKVWAGLGAQAEIFCSRPRSPRSPHLKLLFDGHLTREYLLEGRIDPLSQPHAGFLCQRYGSTSWLMLTTGVKTYSFVQILESETMHVFLTLYIHTWTPFRGSERWGQYLALPHFVPLLAESSS